MLSNLNSCEIKLTGRYLIENAGHISDLYVPFASKNITIVLKCNLIERKWLNKVKISYFLLYNNTILPFI